MKTQQKITFRLDIEIEKIDTPRFVISQRWFEIESKPWESGEFLKFTVHEIFYDKKTFNTGVRQIAQKLVYDHEVDFRYQTLMGHIKNSQNDLAKDTINILLRETAANLLKEYAPKEYQFYKKQNYPLGDCNSPVVQRIIVLERKNYDSLQDMTDNY